MNIEVILEETAITNSTPQPEEEKSDNSTQIPQTSVHEVIPDAEEKLKTTIESMESALAQSGSPDFKTFWEARKQSFELFKQNIPPAVKAIHWNKYRELTKEAKRLKDHFEEQTAFAVEQIEIAIKALEKDIEESGSQKGNVPTPPLPHGIKALSHNESKYLDSQKELNFLNTLASRINAMRKELIRTEMRIRHKNKFFQRLSTAGDKVFPRRKELIKEVSDTFVSDVSDFVTKQFKSADLERSLHQYRDEIKALQQAAKILTLNTHAFTQTRLLLSECWDKLKLVEKERKKEYVEQRQVSKERADAVREKIKAFSDAITAEQSTAEIQKLHDEASSFMRSQELSRDDVRALRDELNQAYKPFKDRLKTEEQKRHEQELLKEKERRAVLDGLEAKITSLDISKGTAELTLIEEEIASLGLSGNERDRLERLLTPFKDAVSEIEEVNLVESVSSDPKALKKILQRKIERRTAIKEQLEQFRKAGGSSGLDFERSLHFNEQVKNEKVRLEAINESISTLEARIAKLKNLK